MNSLLKNISTSWKFAAVLFLIAFLQYSNTLTHDFAWDDAIVITDNSRVQEGISGIPQHFLKYKSEQLEDQYGYRPITLSFFSFEYSLFDPGDEEEIQAGGFHFFQVFYFSLLCGVLFFALIRLFPKVNPWFHFAVALLFTVHPIHTEVVANIKSRDEIFSLLFALLGLIQFLKWHEARKWLSFGLSLLFMVLAALSKENAITYLAVFPLALFIQPEGDWKQKLKSLAPYPILIAVALFVLLVIPQAEALDASQYDESMDAGIFHEDKMLGNSLFAAESFAQRLATIFTTLLLYLKTFVFPWPLRFYYGYNQIPLTSFGDPIVLLSLVLHLAAGGFAVWKFRKLPMISFGILYYFITLSVYTNIFVLTNDTMADRFLFMPSVGLCLIVVFGLARAFKVDLSLPLIRAKSDPQTKKQKRQASQQNRLTSPGLLVALVAIGLVWSFRTFDRNPAWKNNETLFSTDVVNLKNCARAHYHYAGILSNKLEKDPRNQALAQKTIDEFRRAYEISDESYYARMKLGRIYLFLGRNADAISVLQELVTKFPEQGRPHFHLGYAHFVAQQPFKAIEHFEIAREMTANRADLYFYLAQAYYAAGSPTKAIQTTDEGIVRFPEQLSFYDMLSDLYFSVGDSTEGIVQLERVLEKDPDHQDAHKKLILRYDQLGRMSDAMRYYNAARKKGIDLSGLPFQPDVNETDPL